jgi:DNA-binding XRE family transcriptional regulator/tetratricopeptide (TPR) repeat protein
MTRGGLVSTDERDSFAGLLRTLRRARVLTQEELAEASGVSVRTVRELEAGRVRVPQRRTAALLADVLNLSEQERSRFLVLARGDRAFRLAPRPGAAAEGANAGNGAVGADAANGAVVADGANGAVVADGAEAVNGANGAHADGSAHADDGANGVNRAEPAPAELPAAVADVTGRDPELALIRAHATDVAAGNRSTASVVLVSGPPGIGKTSLAVLAGTQARMLFPDGQIFADLRGTDAEPADPGEVLARFLRSLGVTRDRLPAALPERVALFRTLTTRMSLLVVLDNAADEAQVRPLLAAGPRCLTLVTSRRPLSGLECVERIGLAVLTAEAARDLLGRIVGERVGADPGSAGQLAELCGYLPLALRIAGNRLATRPLWTVRHLVDQLRDQRQRLTALTAGDLGVRAAFDVSYRQLPPAAAAMFRYAALIPGPDFAADLAGAVCGYDPPAALDALEQLVDAGLLLSSGVRYHYHDLVRLYAREHLDREPAVRRNAASDRMVTWLLARTVAAGQALDAESVDRSAAAREWRAAAHTWLAQEADNWLAALHLAARHGRHREVVAATRALHWYSDTATHRHPWTEVFELGVASAEAAGSPADEVVLRNFLGWALYLCAERYSEARATLWRSLAQARDLGDRREEAWALTYLAAIDLRTGRPEQVPAPSRQAAALFTELGYVQGEETAQSVLAAGLAALGQGEQALRIHRMVLKSYQRRRSLGAASTEPGEAGTTLAIAQDLAGLGRYSEAARMYAEARELFRRAGMPHGEAVTAYWEGLLQRDTGADAAAAASLAEAARIFAELGAVSWELRARDALSTVDGETTGVGQGRDRGPGPLRD